MGCKKFFSIRKKKGKFIVKYYSLKHLGNIIFAPKTSQHIYSEPNIT